MFDDATELTVEEVDGALSEIENKYSPVRITHKNDSEVEENLTVLSKEFDSIGVPSLNLSQPLPKIFKELITSARCLVQIHRRTLVRMKDTNIASQTNSVKNNYLHKVVENYQSKIDSCEDKNAVLENHIAALKKKLTDLKRKDADIRHEMDKLKRYHVEQESDFLRQIKKLSDENRRLKEADADVKCHSKDEVLLKFVGKYKSNEKIYKATISKLEENNRQLVGEIIDMKCRENLSPN